MKQPIAPLFSLLLFGFFQICVAELRDAKIIRNMLFKSKYLLHKQHSAIHANILKNINFQQADDRTIPSLAICNVKKANSSKNAREMFLKSIISAIKCVNKIIVEHRNLVILAKNQGTAQLSAEQKEKFDMICSFYQTSNMNELLKRVAPVPISLAAAQAALESGLGSNKYICGANAYFGIMKNSRQLHSFDTLFESAIAYAKTLNVNGNYRYFRDERLKMLNLSEKIDGIKLCAFIGGYSMRKSYRKEIAAVIKKYNLTSFDQNYRNCHCN